MRRPCPHLRQADMDRPSIGGSGGQAGDGAQLVLVGHGLRQDLEQLANLGVSGGGTGGRSADAAELLHLPACERHLLAWLLPHCRGICRGNPSCLRLLSTY
jgi:hypothetical protein